MDARFDVCGVELVVLLVNHSLTTISSLYLKLDLTGASPILERMVDCKSSVWATSFVTRTSRKCSFVTRASRKCSFVTRASRKCSFVAWASRKYSHVAVGKKGYCYTLTYTNESPIFVQINLKHYYADVILTTMSCTVVTTTAQRMYSAMYTNPLTIL